MLVPTGRGRGQVEELQPSMSPRAAAEYRRKLSYEIRSIFISGQNGLTAESKSLLGKLPILPDPGQTETRTHTAHFRAFFFKAVCPPCDPPRSRPQRPPPHHRRKEVWESETKLNPQGRFSATT